MCSDQRGRVVLCALCFLCGLGGRASGAVSDFIGKPVAAVRITIEDRDTADPAVTQIVETATGGPLSMAQVRESITHLFSLGRFEDVRVDASLENGGVVLHYDLRPIHPVAAIRFDGGRVPGVDQNALRRVVTDRFGITPPLARAAEMARAVEGALADRGYLHAAAVPRSEISHEPERATLVFALQPNARTTIGSVDVTGPPSVSGDRLRRELKLEQGAPYQRDQMMARIERALASRRKRGYYEARIVPTVTLADDDRVANIALRVDPGPHVKVVFAGDPLPRAQQEAFVPIEREGSADEDLLEDSSRQIEEYFRAAGYRDAAAPHSREAANGELLITFTIRKGPLYKVSEYDVAGNASVTLDELASKVRVAVGQPFAESRLDADVSAIETLYRQRGFARVRAQTSTRFTPGSEGEGVTAVAISITILEGTRTTVDRIDYAGNRALAETDLQGVTGLRAGAPYVPGEAVRDRDAIQALYQDRGYLNATVEVAADPGAEPSAVVVTFRVNEGQRVLVDHVLIVGNVRTRTETIERELQIKPQQPFSLSAINESQRRLAALGLFRRARITEVGHGSETTRDLLVTIEEAPPTTIGYGAGIEARRAVVGTNENGNARESFDVAPRALFEVTRRNMFGRNRSISVFTSVSRSVQYSLTEYRGVITFREPRLFDTPAAGFITGTFEQQHRSSFDFARRAVSANVQRRFDSPYSVIGTYQVERTRVFNQQASGDANLIERAFPKFLLSSFAGTIIRDTRDDQVDAKEGTFFSGTGQWASEALGSEFAFIKTSLTGQLFRRLPGTNQVVFAGNARLGLARGFTAFGDPSGIERVGPLPASERFFAGGDTTQRGVALDQLGVPGQTIDSEGFATGGNAALLFNAELRVPVTVAASVVGFVDTGNVFARASDVRLADLRNAVGGGIRYKSPIGPLRFDVGINVNKLPGEKRTAWFVNFGQAF